ncbi:MAG: acylphosphatase, partial [Hyphomicrobium sp.]|nr:acylphosphatase [Hyphomicrobium sp.]
MFVERTAVALGLDGWVRNRRDGGVEAIVSGTPAAIEEMIARCHAGPPAA